MKVQKSNPVAFKGVIVGRNPKETGKLARFLQQNSSMQFKLIHPELSEVGASYTKDSFILVNKNGSDLDGFEKIHNKVKAKTDEIYAEEMIKAYEEAKNKKLGWKKMLPEEKIKLEKNLNWNGESLKYLVDAGQKFQERSKPYIEKLEKVSQKMFKKAKTINVEKMFQQMDEVAKASITVVLSK